MFTMHKKMLLQFLNLLLNLNSFNTKKLLVFETAKDIVKVEN